MKIEKKAGRGKGDGRWEIERERERERDVQKYCITYEVYKRC